MATSANTRSGKPSAGAEALDIARTVGLALLVALTLRVLLFQPFTIPSASMEPGVRQGDYIIVSKFDYGWSRYSIPLGLPLFRGRLLGQTPARGDVVVFQLPRDPKVSYIKRIIGLPGDRVRVRGGVVLVNGRPIPRRPAGQAADPDQDGAPVALFRETAPDGRPYLTFDRGPGHEGDDTETYRVPKGAYFVMGDNRDNSLDSRWPTETGVGLVPAENLVGRARFILLSWRAGVSVFKPWTWVSDLAPSRFLKPIR